MAVSFLNKFLGKGKTIPIIEAQNALAARARDLGPDDKQFLGRSLLVADDLWRRLSQTPIPNALPVDSFTAAHFLRFYKIAFAYYWMLLIQDRHLNSRVRRMLTTITDQNGVDTDRLCDDFEVAFIPNDPEDPRFTVGKIAWEKMRASIPTNRTVDALVHMAFPITFDSFRTLAVNMSA